MRALHTTVIGILAIMLLCFFTLSCSQESLIEPNKPPVDKPEEVAEEGKSYFSINLTAGDEHLVTRAEEAAGTIGEQTVESIFILLFSSDNKLRYCFNLDAKTDGSGIFNGADVLGAFGTYPGPTKSSFRTNAKLIKSADYKLLVVANPKGEMKDRLPSLASGEYADGISDEEYGKIVGNPDVRMLLDTYTTEVYEKDPSFFFDASSAPKNFTMTNANGIINLTKTNLKTTVDEAKKSPVSVSIDRVVAKVMVKKGSNFEVRNGQLANVTNPVIWVPIVTNKVTYLTRMLTNYSDINMGANKYMSLSIEPTANPGATLLSRKYLYAKDPNFDSEHNSIASDYSASEPGLAMMMPLNEYAADGNSTTDKIEYVLENTMSFDRQKHADWKNYTTQVLIYAYIINPGGLTATNYYSFKKDAASDVKVFTHAQAVDWVSINSFPSDMTGLKEAIQADIASGNQQFNFSGTETGGFRSSQGITYHPGGLNKYRLPLKHFVISGAPTPAQQNVYGYHGVVRNNLYTVTIGSITGPGDGSLDNRYISGNITINPWWVRDPQNEDLVYEEF